MEPQNSRLRQNQQARETVKESSTTEFQMFHSVEDLLRKDAEQNPPPAALAHRVAGSIQTSSKSTEKNWWQKLLGE